MTARQTVPGKRGATPADAPPIFERLSMSGETWCELARNFGRLFYNVAGHPHRIEATRNRQTNFAGTNASVRMSSYRVKQNMLCPVSPALPLEFTPLPNVPYDAWTYRHQHQINLVAD